MTNLFPTFTCPIKYRAFGVIIDFTIMNETQREQQATDLEYYVNE